MHAVSDTHFGAGKRDDRTRDERQLFCDTLPQDDLVLCGDTFDWWRFGGAVVEANKDVIAALEGHTQKRVSHGSFFPFLCAWYITGNHDSIADVRGIFSRVQVCERLLLDKTYYCHGHEWDLINGRFGKVGKAITGIGNMVGRVSPRAEDWLASVAGKMRNTGRYGEAQQLARSALGFIRHWPQARQVVCGHSHVRGEARDAETGKRYVNLGTWAQKGEPIWTEI